MAISNLFDLLGGDENDDPTQLLEEYKKMAEIKAVEDANARAEAKKIADFAALRAAAHQEDKEREEAKKRVKKEAWKLREKERLEKQHSEDGSDAGTGTGTGTAVPLSGDAKVGNVSGRNLVNNDNRFGEDKINKKAKERQHRPIGVFPGDCEKPRLPPLPRRKYYDVPSIPDEPDHRESDHESGHVNGDGTGYSERPSSAGSDIPNGNETVVGYELPPSKHLIRRNEKNKNGGVAHANIKDATVDVLTKEPVDNPKTEVNALTPEGQVEKTESVVSEEHKDAISKANKKAVSKSNKNAVSEENKDAVAMANKKREEEAKYMTLIEFEKVREEKRKALIAMKTTQERKVPVDKELEKMKQLSLKKDKTSTKSSSDKDVSKRREDTTIHRDENVKKANKVQIFFKFKRYVRPQREFNGDEVASSAAAAASNGNAEQSTGGQPNSHAVVSNGNHGGGRGGQNSARYNENQDRGRGNNQQPRQGYEVGSISPAEPQPEFDKEFPALKTA